MIKKNKINEMSETEFAELINKKIAVLNDFERTEVIKLINRTVENFDDEVFSLRETILLNIQAIISSHDFSKKHHEELNKVDVKELTKESENGGIELSPSEILLLGYLDGCSVKLNLPGYFTHEYGIDYKYSLKRMIDAEYITFADVEYSLKKLSVQKLKELLKDNQLIATGKKDELVSRICSNVSKKCLAPYDKQYFVLTSKGNALLLENSHIKYFHSMQNQIQISIEEANEYKKYHETVSNREIAFALLNERLRKEQSEKNWGLFRNTYYSKSVVCFFEKDSKQQLEYLIDVCYMDKVLDERYRVANPSYPMFASGIIDRIQSILQTEQIDKEEFKRIFKKAVYSFFEENEKYVIPFNNEDTEEVLENLFAVLCL